MGQYDHLIDWFKKRHDTLIDDFESLQAGSRRVMEFDGSEWRDITPKIITETTSTIADMEFFARIYQLRSEYPPNLDSSSSEQRKFHNFSQRREAAGDFGFLIFIQVFDGPDRPHFSRDRRTISPEYSDTTYFGLTKFLCDIERIASTNRQCPERW